MSNSISKVRYALAGLLLFFCAAVQAQNISGNVKDSNGEPIIGATIMEQGTQNGTVTDFDGNFTLKLQKGGNLNISYVGMKPQVIKTAGKASVNVTLEDDNTTLNDVVVVGYGTMKRKDLTGSVSSVTGDAIAAVPVANVAEAMQGKLSGVNIMTQDGRPGATQSVVVRGGGSITQSNDPLFVVDGVIVDQIDDIPADQIESIDVLKDASSTAIYGARGANGVILVTTKQAKEGKPQIKYGMYYQISAKPKKLDTESAYDIVMRDWAYSMTRGEQNDIANFYGIGSANGGMDALNQYKGMGTHNYVDDITQTGHMWNHDLSVSGGTEKTKYFASVNFTDSEGTLKNAGYNRWNINFKLQQELAKTLSLDLNARYSETRTQGNDNAYAYASQAYRYAPIDNILGTGDSGDLGSNAYDPTRNPNGLINDISDDRKVQRVSLNTGLTWKAFKGFVAKTELYVGRNWSQEEKWLGGHYYDFEDKNVKNPYSTATIYKKNGYSTRWDTTLSYDFSEIIKNDDHSLNVMVGNEVLGSRSNTFQFAASGYPKEWSSERAFANPDMYDSKYDVTTKNNIGAASHTISWFGRANYNLLGRYLFTFTMRADGSSKFAEGNRWGYFPAGAVAWRISDEPFMKNTQDWLDNLKLRLSIGTSGNDGIDPGAFIDKWEQTKSDVDGSYSYTKGEIMGNPNLTWEKTTSRNLGVDYSFLNGKFNGSVDLYWNTTDDCLMLVPINPANGFSKQFQNVAKTSNKGVELAFNYNIIDKKDFNLRFGLTYNYNVNKVERVASANLGVGPTYASTALIPQYPYAIREGEPVGLLVGFESDGFYKVEDFNVVDGVWTLKDGVADSDTKLSNYYGKGNYTLADGQNAFPGMPKYKDIDGNGTIEEADQTVIGRMAPKHTGGFNFSGRYKNFDFSANFAYQLDGKVFNANLAKSVFSGVSVNEMSRSRLESRFDNSWRMYDIDANGNLYPVTNPTELAALNAGAQYGLLGYTQSNAILSSDYVENAAFLRMQSLTLGYTIPKTLVNKIGISNARVYFTAGNLFIIKAYDGLDPDVSTVSSTMDKSYNGFPTPGYDYNAYPRSRTFTFGLNVAF